MFFYCRASGQKFAKLDLGQQILAKTYETFISYAFTKIAPITFTSKYQKNSSMYQAKKILFIVKIL